MKTIYTGAKVFTGALPLQEAFAVEDGRFCAVGTLREVEKNGADRIVDLGGAFVCPGFIDSHMHMLNYGNAMQNCDLSEATGSLKQVQQALADFAKQRGLGREEWLIGRGWNQDCFVPATGIPTRDDLDQVSCEHPICIVRCCGHCLSVNSRALEMLGIDEQTPAPEGGTIERDEAGRLNGIFMDTAMPLVQGRLPAPDKAALKRMILASARALNAVGVTSCHTDDLCTFEHVGWRQVIEAFRELEEEGALSVRVYEQSQLDTPHKLRDFLSSGFGTGVGSDRFKIGPLKLVGDGSLGARTAYMSRSYADAPDEKGLAIFTQEQFDELIAIAREQGMQVAVHAIGDGILDMILNAYEKVFKAYPAQDHRCGIVHVQLTRPDQLERMKVLGLHAYAQTIFIDYDSHVVYERAGRKLADSSYAFRTLLHMGVHVSNGTDCPVEKPDPMRGIQCAVTRQPLNADLPPYRAEEQMTVEEALGTYTSEGAYASFEENVKGRIAPGMLADFTVLDQNPFETDPQTLASIRVLQTWLGGERVYSRD